MEASLLAFVPVAALLIAAPGPDVVLVVRNSVLGQFAGVATAVGTVVGLLVHGAAAVAGLYALIATSAVAFTVVKLVGAFYLVYLGVRLLWSSRSSRGDRSAVGLADRDAAKSGSSGAPSAGTAMRQGFLTNVLNPKVAVFFLAFLPQFVPTGAPLAATTALLAALFVAMTACYLLVLVTVTVRAAALLGRPAVRRRLDQPAGAVFIAFGVRLATTAR